MRHITRLVCVFGLIGGLTGCGDQVPSFLRAQVPQEVIESDVKGRLVDSQVTYFVLEKRTIQWVEQNMAARYGEELKLSDAHWEHDPNRSVWMAYAEGTLSPSIWPSAGHNYTGFSKMLMLISPDEGRTLTMVAKPLPPK